MRIGKIPSAAGIAYRLLREHGPISFARYAWYLTTAARTGRWEWWLRDAVPLTGSVAVDAGASFGQWSRWLATRFDRVVAFEPNPDIRPKLRRNTPPHVHIMPYALWDSATQLSYTTYADSRVNRVTSHDLLHTVGQGRNGTKVPSITLDSLCLMSLDFVKVDVEGAEAHVLRGARSTLSLYHPKLIIEIHSAAARAGCERVLKSLGYRWEYRHFPFTPPGHPLHEKRLWLVTCSR